MLSERFEEQAIDAQKAYEGDVWLDRVRLDQLGFAVLGLVPQSRQLRWKLLTRDGQLFDRGKSDEINPSWIVGNLRRLTAIDSRCN